MHTESILLHLDADRREAMLELASSCCPRLDARAYLGARLSHYDYAIVSEAGGRNFCNSVSHAGSSPCASPYATLEAV